MNTQQIFGVSSLTKILAAVNFLLIVNFLYACKKDCAAIECKNGGIEVECGCRCPEGFTGPDCGEIKCATNCYNGGTCVDGKCDCPPGWGGPDCASPVDMCAGANPCQNGGKCEDGKCKCPDGCYGTFCESCTETVTIRPNELSQICFENTTPEGGDKNFAGMGVNVAAKATLKKVNGRELWVDIEATLSQTTSDIFQPYTSAKLEKSVKIWTAPSGKKIMGFNKSGTAQTAYTDYDIGVDERECPGTFVQQFNIQAETDGDDLGGCTFNYAYLTLKFAYLDVKLLPE